MSSFNLVDFCNAQQNPKDCNGHGICQNNDSEEGYSCYCEPGFTGSDCEIGMSVY